jgi:hypothetical protein
MNAPSVREVKNLCNIQTRVTDMSEQINEIIFIYICYTVASHETEVYALFNISSGSMEMKVQRL